MQNSNTKEDPQSNNNSIKQAVKYAGVTLLGLIMDPCPIGKWFPSIGRYQNEAQNLLNDNMFSEIGSSTEGGMSKINHNNLQSLPPQRMTVAQAFTGTEGMLVFAERGYSDVFFSPKDDDTNFYQLHSLRESSSHGKEGTKREISVAADMTGGSFSISVEYGRTANLMCAGKASVYSCLSADEVQVIREKIQSGKTKLFSLPIDHKVEYAVEIPKAIKGMDGDLIITSPMYNSSYAFGAYVVPRNKTLPTEKFDIEGVTRMRDGGTTFMTIGKTHEFCAVTPYNGGEISIDDKTARKLSEAKVNDLVADGRIPSVPKTPTQLITPFTSSLAGGPNG